jgi:mannose-6-phosphate isomerase-like protein (cupin superfamily)
MKRFKFSDLHSEGPEHIAANLVPDKYIVHGGLSFHTVGWRTHPEGEHRHAYYEVFGIMQGRGEIEINGQREPIHAGEVLVIEPDEDHHVVGDPDYPIINLWFNFADEPREDQRGK